jgi:LDH2 family malate/lactate/ureidoglycolate dehydrogenase
VTAAARRFAEDSLLAFAAEIVAGLGASAWAARTVAASLVQADRRGVHTHGVVRLPSYCAEARQGRVVAGALPQVVRQEGPVALVDGGGGFGAVTGAAAMDSAIEAAERFGIGFVAARGCTHFGAAAFYTLRAVERGLVGVAATSTPAVMAPWGGAEARLGNNPLSVAAPMPAGRPPFVLDLAQSAVSRGRIKLAELAGEQIPESWALDGDGRPTRDPAAALAGALLPSGGYKGSGLALAVEVLTGVLAGGELGPELINMSLTGSARSGSATKTGTVASIYAALDPERFVGREAFTDRMGRLADLITSTPPAAGFTEVLLPGGLEARAELDAEAQGIPLDDATVELLQDLAAAESVAFPVPT